MRGYDKNCPFCRFMRSLAFSGLGMAIGSGVAYLLGASKENVMLSGIFVAAVIVFGKQNNKKRQ